MAHDELKGICSVVRPLGDEETSHLSDGVLCRIIKGDKKGRPFGTPRNPGTPTVPEFNPRVGEILAGELAGKVTSRKHGIFPDQADRVKQLSDEELLRFRLDDPMSGSPANGGFSITGGHHRMHEISRRVRAGELPADTPVRILFHD